MTVEERLRVALSDEADALDVDLLRLHAETRARGASAPPPRRGPALLVAACVLLVAGTAVAGALLAGLGPGRRTDLATDRPDRAPVDTSFTCAHQRTWRFEEGRAVGDDGFVPDLAEGPAAMARLVGAPRYELTVHQDTATLRLGNTDGTLASRSDFVRGPDGWLPVRALTCQGDGTPLVGGRGGTADRLAVRPSTPGAADDPPLSAGDVGRGATLLDRRGYYDVSGLLHDRTVWAAPCGRKVCVRAGVRDSYVAADVAPGVPPTDLTSVFLPPDDMVGIAPPYAFVVVAEAGATVTWRDTAGTQHDAQPVEGTWYVLAPYDDLEEVVVEPRDGAPRAWVLDEMR
jgi:hypothetical protein